MFVAAQAGMGLVDWKGKENPLIEAVRAISITERKSPEELELEEMRGPVVAERWQDDPRLKKPKEDKSDLVKYGPADDDVIPRWVIEGDDCAEENADGSFETLMGGWTSRRGPSFDTHQATRRGTS